MKFPSLLVLSAFLAVAAHAAHEGPVTGSGPEGVRLATVVRQSFVGQSVCSITAAGTVKTSVNLATGEKTVERLATQYGEFQDLTGARRAAQLLGEKIVQEEGPTDAPSVVASLFDIDGVEHAFYSMSGGEIVKDASPVATGFTSLLQANCAGIF